MDSLMLSNPLCKFLDKPVSQFTRADLLRVIEEKNIERVTFHYTAVDGKLKELKLPLATRHQAERILADGERVDGSSLFKGMVDASMSDLYVVPVYSTAFLNPFDKGSLDFVCRYLNSDGERAPFTLDNILYNAGELFKKNTGYELYALGELEFFLISEPNRNIFNAPKQAGYHASSPYVKSGDILNEMIRYITQISGAVKYGHSEVGYVESVRSDLAEIRGKSAEQLEIEYLPRPIAEMGDHLVLGRWIIRNVAYRHGMVATFAPKLEEGVAGNGMHIHMEIRKDGKNVMVAKDGSLSQPARKLVGGFCKYASSLTSFGNTVSSAFLRLVPNQEAPTRVCWSDSNRSAMIRVPLGWSKTTHLAKTLNPQQVEGYTETEGRQTVELRSPDGSAIIHLLLAGMAMAAEWGLQNEESLQLADAYYTVGNIFKDKKLLKKLPVLPKSCVESAQLLKKQRTFYERENIFPASVIDYVIKMLLKENDEDMNAFLSDLPADDRLHKTRRIMHKDIHKH